jgi:hypothetical protein
MNVSILVTKARAMLRKQYLRAIGHPSWTCAHAHNSYLVNEENGFIYGFIPKVASGSLTVWFLKTLGHNDVSVGSHGYARSQYSLLKKPLRISMQMWERLFKFAFVRNPWSRLLSSYVSIFLHRRDPQPSYELIAKPVIARIRKQIGGLDRKGAYVTFSEFARWVCSNRNDYMTNPHWRSQSWFVEPESMDFIGRFEKLNEDMEYIVQRFELRCSLPHRHKTDYKENDSHDALRFFEIPSTRLQEMKRLPSYRHFYSSELKEMVAERYRRDIQLFGYRFEDG